MVIRLRAIFTSEMLFNSSEVHGVGFEPTRFYTTALKAVTLTTRSSMLKRLLWGLNPRPSA